MRGPTRSCPSSKAMVDCGQRCRGPALRTTTTVQPASKRQLKKNYRRDEKVSGQGSSRDLYHARTQLKWEWTANGNHGVKPQPLRHGDFLWLLSIAGVPCLAIRAPTILKASEEPCHAHCLPCNAL